MTDRITTLYVDDDADLLSIGKLFLERLGDFSVTTILSATEAIELLNNQFFDAIISDYQMPRMDGIEFLKQIRASGNILPFILFTGKGREDVVIQALNEGADYYLQKGGDPIPQFAELAHKIRLAVKERRLEKSVRDHERRESDIINFLPDATFAINREGIVIAWNRAMESMTGVSSADIIGKGDYEYALPFYHERRPILINLVLGDDPDTYSKYSTIKQDGNLLSAEITIPHFNEGAGASLWFTASPLYDNQGVVIGGIESIRDITDIKQAELKLLKNYEELQTAYEEIHSADEELRIHIEKMDHQEQNLKEKEDLLDMLESHIPGVVFRMVVNPDGFYGFNYINSRSMEILGIENNPDRFSERITENICTEDREQFLNSIQDAISKKIVWNFKGHYIKPTGEMIRLTIISKQKEENGTVIFDGIMIDDSSEYQ